MDVDELTENGEYLREAHLLVKGFKGGFIPNAIDIKVKGQWLKLWIRTLEEKSYREALIENPRKLRKKKVTWQEKVDK